MRSEKGATFAGLLLIIFIVITLMFVIISKVKACEDWNAQEVCNYCCQWENPKKAYEAHMDMYEYAKSKKEIDSSYFSIDIFMWTQASYIDRYCLDKTKYKREKCDCSPD